MAIRGYDRDSLTYCSVHYNWCFSAFHAGLSSCSLVQDKFPFKCHFCSAKYGTHKTLKTHISKNHGNKLKQRGGKKLTVVWTPSDTDNPSSDEAEAGNDQHCLLRCEVPKSKHDVWEGGEEDGSSSVSGMLGESDLYDANESGQETSEGGGEESVRSGEGEVWRQGGATDPIVVEDLVTDTVSLERRMCVRARVCVHAYVCSKVLSELVVIVCSCVREAVWLCVVDEAIVHSTGGQAVSKFLHFTSICISTL